MSHYPFDRSFHPRMSRTLLRLATDFRMDNRIVPWDELTGSDTIMNELAHQLRRSGWPKRTYEEVRKELLRLHDRWKKVVVPKSENFRRIAANNPCLWTEESEDEDDIFMPAASGFCIVEGQEFFIIEGQGFCIIEGQEFFIVEGQEFCIDRG